MGQGFESLQACHFLMVSQQRDMVGIAQLVRAPDCGSGCRGFESHYPPHITSSRKGRSIGSGPSRLTPCVESLLPIQGCSQVVRQGTLTPSLAGSSPAIPANSSVCTLFDPVAQSAEHLPFKQGVRGSNPRWSTKPLKLLCFKGFFFCLEKVRHPA